MSPRLRRSLREGSHKLDIDEPTQLRDDDHRAAQQQPAKGGQRRVLHEAAHKLDVPEEAAHEDRPAPRVFETERDVVPQAGRAALALAALGVVFGDLGTSPLYTEQVVFTQHRAAAQTTAAGVYGVVSLIFWALVIVVSFKYAGAIMRAHNRGDGGVLALTALIRRCKPAHGVLLVAARNLRRVAVPRGRHDHPGDLGPVGSRGAEGRDARRRASRHADRARDPDFAVLDPAPGHRRRRRPVRPGDARMVHGAGNPRHPWGCPAPRGFPRFVAHVRSPVPRQSWRGCIPHAGCNRAGGDGS